MNEPLVFLTDVDGTLLRHDTPLPEAAPSAKNVPKGLT